MNEEEVAERKHRRYMAIHVRRVQRALLRANAPGKEERIAAAQAKRDRKKAHRTKNGKVGEVI